MRYIIIRFIRVSLTVLILNAVVLQAHANNGKDIDLWDPVFYLEEDGSRYVRFTSALQIWLRHTDLNPGSGISGTPATNATDLSIRRLRPGLSSVPIEKTFFRLNLGFNNLNQATKSNVKIEFLDVYAEYRPSGTFELGTGKSAWTGLSRYIHLRNGEPVINDLKLWANAYPLLGTGNTIYLQSGYLTRKLHIGCWVRYAVKAG